MTHNSSENFKLTHFLLWAKGSHQSPNSDTFKCSSKNLPNSSCNFPNHKSVFASLFSFMKDNSLYFFQIKRYILCTKGTNQSASFWDFQVLGSKFTKFLSFYERTNQFFSKFCVTINITPLYHFSWSFIYFQQKEPIKVQIWWNFLWAVESLKFCSLMFSFCLSHIKFLLKKYRKVVSPDTGEWWKDFLKNWLVGSKWHEEFGEFSLNHSKVRKFHFDGLFLSKEYNVWAKKYRGVVFHDTEQWHKTWINLDLVVSNWHEKFGELSLEHSKVWKIVLLWGLFVHGS